MSPTYAEEITTPEFAYGLQGLLSGLKAQGRLVGILNGVDEKYLASERGSIHSTPLQAEIYDRQKEKQSRTAGVFQFAHKMNLPWHL